MPPVIGTHGELVMPGHSSLPFRRLRKLVCDPGHPRLNSVAARKTWMAGTSPAMTKKRILFNCIGESLAVKAPPSKAVFVREKPLAQHGVDTPIAVDHLRDAEIHRRRNQRDRFVLAQAPGIHQKSADFAKRVLHRQIER
jgi:hypothetical protein